MSFLALVAACAAAALWVVPREPGFGNQRIATIGSRRSTTSGSRRIPGQQRAAVLRKKILAGLGLSQPGAKRDDAALIGATLISVAARLRAGQSPEAAWAGSIAALPEELGDTVRSLALGGLERGDSPGVALRAASAATRLAKELGADLAGVLDSCAEGIEESTRAQADRDAAFAAPRATARVLLALPLLGVGLGAVMGAKPWSFFTSSWWGILLALTGAAFFLVGRWWIRVLLGHAQSVSGTHR